MTITRNKEIRVYRTKEGYHPFLEWLESLNKTIKHRIQERLDRIVLGNLGDYKYIKDGVLELRFDFGAGYRVYYGEDGKNIVLLLCGGDKSRQKKDIKKALTYWKEYLGNEK